MLALIIVVSVLVTILVCYTKSPHFKGKFGEKLVYLKLKSKSSKQISNLVLFDGEMSSQIDHVVVSEKGIIVIETKNYAGRIYGSDNQLNWTQVLAYGKVKNQFYSPVKQNNKHVYLLSNLLDTKNIINLVVFVRADISNVDSKNTITLGSLKKYIRNLPTILDATSIDFYYNKLVEANKNKIISNKEHVQNIKKLKTDIENGICPRCKGKLVIRSYQGKEFYGCSNYPKCKFTKKIDN